METKKLVLTFKNEEGKSASMTLNKFKEPIVEADIKAAMEAIAASDAFLNKEGLVKYVTPVSARTVVSNTDDVADFELQY
jgi:hypothetical protein